MSNRYRLIKEYPGSPKLGNTIDNLENDWIENYPEFWEKVVEKDYEILSYIHNGSKHIWKKDSQLKDTFCLEDGKSPFTRLEDILKYPKIYLIHSVKRNDGEIFTIGDKVFSEYVNYTINKIDIVNDKCMVSALYDTNNPNGSRLHYNLNNLKKAKQKLFTTEDDVDIFENNTSIYHVDKSLNIKFIKHEDFKVISKNVKYFSTKEKAEEYILMNKPVLSLNEIFKDVEEMRKGLKTFENSELAKRFKKLVQQKLKS